MSGETLTIFEVAETERVPPGYKRTEVGVIPEDWNTSTLIGAVDNIIDYRGRTPLKIGMSWGGNIPALSARNVKMGYLDLTEETYYGSDALYRRWMTNGDAEKDDVVLTMEAPLGNVALIPDDRKYILSQRTILLKPTKRYVESRFLALVLESESFQKTLTANATGSTATGIQRRKLEKLCIPLPPLPEQRAIAAALSDVDGLISSLDRLISKKRAVKIGAMQQLLTGKRRLPGFSREWGVKSLEEVADVDSDNLTADTDPDYQFKYISLDDVDEGVLSSFSYQQFSSAPSRARRRVRFGDVLVSTVRPNLKSHLLFSSSGENWVCSTGFSLVRCRKHLASPGFVYQHLFHGVVPGQIEALIAGSNYPAISAKDVRAFQILMPNVEEQTAIAAVLSDMDAEISALEARREKTRQVKQGMMQELLTGRTRLVSEGSSA